MKKVVFEDYAGVNEKILEGYTVAQVSTAINAEGSGLWLELEREVDNVTLGIDISYNPCPEDGETELMISKEYVKRIS